MRFLGSKFTQNVLAAGAPPWTPLGKLKRSPRSLADFRRPRFAAGERERGRSERGKGYWGRERAREGKGRGEGGKGKGEAKGKGGGVCVIGIRGIGAPA